MDNQHIRPIPPLDAVPMIRKLDEQLVQLLRTLPESNWSHMAVGSWTVRDVAAHLLDANLRRLSFCRDRAVPGGDAGPQGFGDLLARLNELNAEWIRAAQRLSPRVIIDLLARTNVEVTEYFSSLAPLETAPFAVTWAGDDDSPAWLDVAREFTEKWHHQQQIRAAVSAPPLTDRPYVLPLLNTLILGTRHAYRDTSAPDDTCIRIEVTDVSGLAWLLRRERGGWELLEITGDVSAQASVEIAAEPLWKLLFREAPAEEVRRRAAYSGPAELVDPFFSAVAVMV